ncbi:MAG: chloride channel protein [Herpetosiphon sp.]
MTQIEEPEGEHEASMQPLIGRRRWKYLNTNLLRWFLRLVPSERQRVFALTILIGAFCGLAAVAFHLAIRAAEHVFIDRALAAAGSSWIAWTIVTPGLGALVAGLLLFYVVPDARGSGIPQVKVAYQIKGGQMPFRVGIGKFLLGVVQIGTGSSLGREGPTVQICASIASLLGRATALSRRNMRRLLPVGAAAGIAAAFNAPIAAVTFTIEEVVGDLDQTVLSGVIVAAALAAAIERSILGTHPVFDIPHSYGLRHASSLVLYAGLGILAALTGVVFTDSLLALRKWFRELRFVPAWLRPAIGGTITGGLAVAALLLVKTGGITGAGYETLGAALTGKLGLRVLLVLGVLKIAATVFAYASGGAGGLFAPTLFIGGMLGGTVGIVDVLLLHHGQEEIGAFALVGMGAVFASIIRAPMTSVLIIFEMTGGYELILPLMIANMIAYGLARLLRPLPIYDALLEQDGIQLPHGGNLVGHALEQLRVQDAMTSPVSTLPAQLRVRDAVKQIAGASFSSFPVLGVDRQFQGLVSEARLRRSFAEDQGDRAVGELVDRRPPVAPEQRLVDAVVLMDQWETRQLAVTDGTRALTGIITMSDIVLAQARAARAADPDAGEVGGSMSEVGETLREQR